MALEQISVGAEANDGTGTNQRDAWELVNRLIPTEEGAYLLDKDNGLVEAADLSNTFQWTFDSSTVAGDPDTGMVRFNNVDPALVTEIYISKTSRSGATVQAAADLVQRNTRAYAKPYNTIDTYIFSNVVADSTDNGSWITVPVESFGVGVFNDGEIINISFFNQRGLKEVINVNSLADLPEPSGDVIEMGGGNTVWVFNGKESVDISPYRIEVTGGNVEFRGTNRFVSGLTSDTADTLITVRNANFADNFMNYTAPNAQLYDIDQSGIGQGSAYGNQNIIVRSVDSLGVIKDCDTVAMRRPTIVSVTTGGFVFEGIGLRQFLLDDCFAINYTGTLFDHVTSSPKWDLIEVTGCRMIAPSGSTTMEFLPDGDNFNSSTGRGTIIENVFNGDGTAISGGASSQDLQWSWDSVGIDKTRVNGDAYKLITNTVAVSSANVYYLINGTDWIADISNRFTMTSSGVLTYIGLEDVDVSIVGTATLEKVGGNSNLIAMEIGINGTESAKSIGATQNTQPTQVVSQGLYTLSTGDTVDLRVANTDSSTDIIVDNANLVVRLA